MELLASMNIRLHFGYIMLKNKKGQHR